MPESPRPSNGHQPGQVGGSRPYSQADVERLRGSVRIEYTLARRGAERLRAMLAAGEPVAALGCLTGGQAVEAVKAGLAANATGSHRSSPTWKPASAARSTSSS